jgi:excisionase family DNA binding protein
MPTSANKYLRTAEAASHLRVHSDTVIRWVKEGRLHGVKVGRNWLIVETSVLELLRQENRP